MNSKASYERSRGLITQKGFAYYVKSGPSQVQKLVINIIKIFTFIIFINLIIIIITVMYVK